MDLDLITTAAFVDCSQTWKITLDTYKEDYPWMGEFMVQPFDRKSFVMFVSDMLEREKAGEARELKFEFQSGDHKVQLRWWYDFHDCTDRMKEGGDFWECMKRWVQMDFYVKGKWKKEFAVEILTNPYDEEVSDFEDAFEEGNIMWMSKLE